MLDMFLALYMGCEQYHEQAKNQECELIQIALHHLGKGHVPACTPCEVVEIRVRLGFCLCLQGGSRVTVHMCSECGANNSRMNAHANRMIVLMSQA